MGILIKREADNCLQAPRADVCTKTTLLGENPKFAYRDTYVGPGATRWDRKWIEALASSNWRSIGSSKTIMKSDVLPLSSYDQVTSGGLSPTSSDDLPLLFSHFTESPINHRHFVKDSFCLLVSLVDDKIPKSNDCITEGNSRSVSNFRRYHNTFPKPINQIGIASMTIR